MANHEVDKIEDIDEAINPITPRINEKEGLEMLGYNRNQPVNLSRFSRSFFKIYSHLIALYSSTKTLTTGKENKFSKNSGFNLNKSDVVSDNSNEVFTPKGALNLKNWLVTNYTTLMNNIRESLDTKINTKENAFSKKTGFNLDKTDSINSNSSILLATAKAVKTAYDKAIEAYNKATSNLSKLESLEKDKFNSSQLLKNGLPTVKDILDLEAGVYTISNAPIFELNRGYFTVHRLNDYNDTGDNTIVVYKAGSAEKFWTTSFNSNRWTGWKEFNHCPYHIGDFFFTSSTENPALKWLGTSWEPVEGRMLIGTNSSLTLGKIGGSSQIKLTQGQLPAHRFRVESFSLGRGNMNISGSLGSPTKEGTPYGNGAFRVTSSSTSGRAAGSGNGAVSWDFEASRSWTGTTTSASPYTNSIGNGDNIDILNPYLAVKIWKRIG